LGAHWVLPQVYS
jgi:hypothetical protein